MNPELFIAFLLVRGAVIATPGTVVSLVVATAAMEGMRPMLMTVLGATFGNALLIGAVAFGLSFVLAGSALLFDVIRYAGAAYLIWLGVKLWRNAGHKAELTPAHGGVHVFRGFLVAVSNPKTVAFFADFLPEFIDAARPAGFQLAVMCVASVLMSTMLDAGWGAAAALGSAWLVSPSRAKLLGRFSGAVLVAGGLWLSLGHLPA